MGSIIVSESWLGRILKKKFKSLFGILSRKSSEPKKKTLKKLNESTFLGISSPLFLNNLGYIGDSHTSIYLIKISLYLVQVSYTFQSYVVIFRPAHNKDTTNDNQLIDTHKI